MFLSDVAIGVLSGGLSLGLVIGERGQIFQFLEGHEL
jgi:hypothetical protein